MSLQYLEKYGHFVDIIGLNKLKEQRNKWIDRPSNKEYQDFYKILEKHSPDKVSHNFENYFGVNFNSSSLEEVESMAKMLIPWRKGPFKLNDLEIDSEWRSDMKWERIKEHIGDLTGKKVLDIGCNNGYYMFQMAKESPELLLGIDPVVHNMAQFDFINKFAGFDNLKFELFGVEHITHFKSFFDVIFSMGVLYHHRHPLEQIINMRESLDAGGTLFLETIGIPGDESYCLFPEDRYSKMRNVWFLPTLTCLKNWLARCGFIDIELVSTSVTSLEEQRVTPWCPPPFQSLEDFLDSSDKSKTVEGYPAPHRFCLKAVKKKNSPRVGFSHVEKY